MKNNIEDLNNHLFAALERLNDEDLTTEQIKTEVQRAKAIASLGTTLVASGALSLNAQRLHSDGELHQKPEMLKDKRTIRRLS